MPSNTPNVFVSSTCYDLKQLRVDLKIAIEELGLIPILSEFDSFPVDPDEGTLTNCLRAVESHADIFVLVVGNRYGSKTPLGSSITNAEYLRARAKQIPTYVFVQKDVLAILAVWQRNENGDFSGIVDSTEVLRFVQDLRQSGDVWVFPFENAQDIIVTIRIQLSYLFGEALEARRKLRHRPLPKTLKDAPGAVVRIALEQPRGWEYLLFAKYLSFRLDAHEPLRLDLKYKLSRTGHHPVREKLQLLEFVQGRLGELRSVAVALETLINKALPVAFGPPGKPGDIDHILYAAEGIASAYEVAIKWGLQWLGVEPPRGGEKLVELLSHLPDDIAAKVEKLSLDVNEFADETLPKALAGEVVPALVQIHVSLDLAGTDELNAELERLQGEWCL